MIVSKGTLDWTLRKLATKKVVALDCETTGLRPHHGDRLFSISLADDEDTYYFNFQKYDDIEEELVLDWETIPSVVGACTGVITGHNIKFDLHFLVNAGVDIEKKNIYDTLVIGRVLQNDAMTLSLDKLAEDIGMEKLKTVEEYIKKYKLYEVTTIPGKKTRFKNLHFHKVPFPLISEYAQRDALIAYKLYEAQQRKIAEWNAETKPIQAVVENELALLKVCFEIERNGIRIDLPYIERAIEHEGEKVEEAKRQIEILIDRPFVDSNVQLAKIFRKHKVHLTDKGNPSFTDENLRKINSPIARNIEVFRDHSKRKNTYFESFKFWACSDDMIRASLQQHAAQTGRFSVKDPPLQTLTKQDDSEFKIRRAFLPREGNCLVEMDYKSMEFVLMCDYAGELKVIEKLKAGHDPHQATAELAGVSRRVAKTLAFLLLYGGGIMKLAFALGVKKDEAVRLRWKFFSALREVEGFIRNVIKIAKKRGYIFNFLGRRFHFKDANWAYKAPNALIQGSGADVCKLALVRIHEYLKPYETKIILQIHDSILFDVPPNEFHILPHLKKIMEEAYPFKHIPLSVSVEHSWLSWGDLMEGFPVGREAREFIQGACEEIPQDTRQVLVR